MRDESLLRTPFREIRAVRKGEDGPWSGVLVRTPSGTVGLLVDAAVVGTDWAGWDADPGGHVLTPIDLVRRPGGHDVLLPVCSERLEDFVRRRGAPAALSPGEAVTLGVSVLRGCAQLVAAPGTTGEWWLDDSGRPVLATDASAERAFATAATALSVAEIDPRMQRAWDAAVHAVSAGRVTAREIADAEELLFAAADPEPLSTISLSPRRAVDIAPDGRSAVLAADDAVSRPLWQSLIGSVDADLADSVSKATTAVWRRLRTPARSRRAPLLVGGAVAAAVLVGGALWPAAGGVASGEPPGVGESPAATATPAPTGGEPAPASTAGTDVPPAGDLVTVVAALLDARAACTGDTGCLEGLVADPARPLGAGTIDLPAAGRTLTLLDDFGDVAVLRADANDGGSASQLVVVIRRDEKWLLRDVHDVAQQP